MNYDEKLSIQMMLDRLLIIKLLEKFEGSVSVSGKLKFYEFKHADYMYYDDMVENLTLFFEYANIGEFIIDPDFLKEELAIKDFDGCCFLFFSEDFQRLTELNASLEVLEQYKNQICNAFELNNDIEWLKTDSPVVEFVGIVMPTSAYYWHETVERLIEIIQSIRKECRQYENRCNNQ